MNVPIMAVILVTGVALAFSGLDVTRKLLAERVSPLPLMVWLSLGSLPIFLVWAAKEGEWGATSAYIVPGIASILLNIGANLAFLQAVRVSPLSLTIPYLSLTPVFATLLSIPLLGERPSALQLVGIVLVVAGAFWLQAPSGDRASLRAVWRALAEERGSLLMILTALFWSLASPLDKLAIGASNPLFHGVVLLSGIGVSGLVIMGVRSSLGEMRIQRPAYRLVVLSIVLTAVGLILNLFALQIVWVGFIETLKRALGATLALVWGRFLFNESITANKVVAVALMGVGVGLLLW
jgi:drug/metabolite transporter (DMT)-like permease